MQQFYAGEYATVLILPSAAGGEQLFQYQCIIADVVLSHASPQKSLIAPSTVDARIELVPSPEPAGMAASKVISSPEPNALDVLPMTHEIPPQIMGQILPR